MFVNPKSGGNKAKGFVDIPLDANCRVASGAIDGQSVYIFDIRQGSPGEKPGFIALKAETEKLEPGQYCPVVVCGGDGTVLWVASRVERFGCRATESFESLNIRIRSIFRQNSEKMF